MKSHLRPSRRQPDDPAALLSPDDHALWQSIAGSELWAALRAGFWTWREQLLAETPATEREDAILRGRIATLTDLLHKGPWLVVQYMHMAGEDDVTHQRPVLPPRRRARDADVPEVESPRLQRQAHDGLPGPARYRG